MERRSWILRIILSPFLVGYVLYRLFKFIIVNIFSLLWSGKYKKYSEIHKYWTKLPDTFEAIYTASDKSWFATICRVAYDRLPISVTLPIAFMYHNSDTKISIGCSVYMDKEKYINSFKLVCGLIELKFNESNNFS